MGFRREGPEKSAQRVIGSGFHSGSTGRSLFCMSISGPGNAALWSKLLGKEIKYTGHDFNDWEKSMRARVPSWSAYDLRVIFQGYFDHGFASTETEVARLAQLLERAPRSYHDFARQAAAAWKS